MNIAKANRAVAGLPFYSVWQFRCSVGDFVFRGAFTSLKDARAQARLNPHQVWLRRDNVLTITDAKRSTVVGHKKAKDLVAMLITEGSSR